MIIRKVTINDIEMLIRLRIDYLIADKGSLTEDEQKIIKNQLRYYFPKYIPLNEFLGFIAEENGNIVSTAFLMISERPANPAFITGKVGTLANVLTYPEFRRKGFATRVIEALMNEAKQIGVSSIELFATNDGKPLYEKIGFAVSQNTLMRIIFK